jgi:hypothetical protein
MDMSYTQDVYMSRGTEYDMIWYQIYWNESMLDNFRKSNYVQQRKTYTTKAAKVHLNCYSVITVT